MEKTPQVLVVDDDAEIRALLAEYLGRNGYGVHGVADGRAMREALSARHIDLVILDLMLPGEDGLTLCRDIRARSDLPVIMLTARGEETDRIVGIEMGADDYLPKPFNPRELLARMKSVLRRARYLGDVSPAAGARRLRFAGWTLDTSTRNLIAPDGVVVSLSGAEYRLLGVLLARPDHVFSRDELMELTQRRGIDPYDRSIDVQVSRLRRRLRDDGKDPVIIKTVRSEGYVLAAAVESEA
ncbi:MAG TPA: response regulator [Burkholderiales bacterium]|nr:response regulator [Burkholderiales bacterium]